MHKIPVFQPYLEEEKYGGKAGFFMSENEDKLEKYGQPEGLKQASHIRILTIIGEVEGHENLGNNSKTTKYEHVIPLLAAAEEDNRGRGCGERTCHCGNDCIFKQTGGIPGAWRQSFHRCSTGGVCRLFLYCSDRNDDDSSGPYDRTDYWRVADV